MAAKSADAGDAKVRGGPQPTPFAADDGSGSRAVVILFHPINLGSRTNAASAGSSRTALRYERLSLPDLANEEEAARSGLSKGDVGPPRG